MHFWKDCSEMSLSSLLGALSMVPTPSKGSLWWPPRAWNKSLIEKDQVNWEVVPVQWYSFYPRTAGCSGHCEQVHHRDEGAKIFPATTIDSFRTLREEDAVGSTCRFAPHIKKRDQCDFWFWLFCSFRPSWGFLLNTMVFDFLFVPKKTNVSLPANLFQFKDTRWCSDTFTCNVP